MVFATLLFVGGMIAIIIINRKNIFKVLILIIILPCFGIPSIAASFFTLFVPLTLRIKLEESGIQIIISRICVCFISNKFYRKEEIIKFNIEHQRYRNNFDLILIISDGRKLKIVSDLNKTVNLDETKNLIINKYIDEQMKKDVERDTDTKLCL